MMKTRNDYLESQPILLFDGVCNLCNGAVQFVIKNDKKHRFRFAALQSEAGAALLKAYGLSQNTLDTFVVITKDKSLTRSSAALEVAKTIGGLWAFAYIFIVIPKFIRDTIYNWVARNRYRWFGRYDTCMVPSPEIRDRFIND